MLFADTLHYRLLQLTNLTVNATSSIRQILSAIRYMVLQNRMVLDLVTASQGGVCHIVGTSCCTYIPDNDADEAAISKALDGLKRLSATEMLDQHGTGS